MPKLTEEQQKVLWVDPFPPAPGTPSGAVLQAFEIEQYVTAHNILFDKDAFPVGKLKQASYTMTPDRNAGWLIGKNGKYKPLETGSESGQDYYIVPRNALVFIRLRQTLRLPFYLIGRHNLKIGYVYKGLLLGTGPQVDPGYEGQLYIPLHNLTDENVYVYVDKSFVSIDFVRTTPLPFPDAVPQSLNAFYQAYEKPWHLIERDKVEKRKDLRSYLESARPRSSLGPLVKELKALKSNLEKRKIIDIALIAGIASLSIAVIAVACTYMGQTRSILLTFNAHFDRKVDAIRLDLEQIRTARQNGANTKEHATVTVPSVGSPDTGPVPRVEDSHNRTQPPAK